MSTQDQQTNPGEITKITVTQLLPMVYQDSLQPGVKQLGIALESVLSLVPTLMLPFKYVSEAAKLRLSMRLDKLRKSLENKAIQDVRAIAPEIGVPVVEKLLHVQDDHLASLYLRLLEQASDKHGQESAHPSFPALISNLSPDEAALLQLFVHPNQPSVYPTVHVVLQSSSGQAVLLRGPLSAWELEVNLAYPNNLPAYIQNLVRCGIFEAERGICSDYQLTPRFNARLELLKQHYQPAFGQPMQSGSHIDFESGCLALTEYGQMFIRACVVPQPDLLTGVTL